MSTTMPTINRTVACPRSSSISHDESRCKRIKKNPPPSCLSLIYCQDFLLSNRSTWRRRCRSWIRAVKSTTPGGARRGRRASNDATRRKKLQTNLEQIELDLGRTDVSAGTRLVAQVLQAWVALSHRRTWGMHWICITLFRVMQTDYAERDTLACLSACVRIHNRLRRTPDRVPMEMFSRRRRRLCQVRQESPSFPADEMVEVVQIFVLRSFPCSSPTCWRNLRCAWYGISCSPILRAPRAGIWRSPWCSRPLRSGGRVAELPHFRHAVGIGGRNQGARDRAVPNTCAGSNLCGKVPDEHSAVSRQ